MTTRLPPRFPLFSAQEVREHLLHAAPIIDLQVIEETGSTNVDLLARLSGLDRPACLLAHRQTAGRGRDGRHWMSVPGGSLTFSLAWCFGRPLHALAGLPLAVGVAVADALKQFNVDVRLKWPNDVLKDGCKLAGILIESTTSSATATATWVVIGIGINLDLGESDRQQIGQLAADLPEIGAGDRPRLAALLMDEIVRALAWFDQEGFAPFVRRWNGVDAMAGCDVEILERGRIVHAGTARGVDEAGRLALQSASGPILIQSGEVSLRLRSGA